MIAGGSHLASSSWRRYKVTAWITLACVDGCQLPVTQKSSDSELELELGASKWAAATAVDLHSVAVTSVTVPARCSRCTP